MRADRAASHSPRQQLARQGVRSTFVGIGLNLFLAVSKTVAGTIGNSYALIADGIESLTDVMSSLVVLIGLRVAMRPPDDNHPYGHGKAEPLAATIVALALFAAGVTIAVESFHEIVTPHSMPAAWTLLVLAGVVLVKESLFRYVFKVGESARSIAVRTDAWHHRSDAITSGLAFVGISIAVVGGNGWESADDWAALLASGIIMFNACVLLRPALLELTDSVPGTGLSEDVRRLALTVPGVVAIEKSWVRKMGFDYYVDMHVIVDRDMPVWQGHDIAHAVKAALQLAHPQIANVLVHVEPSTSG